MLPTRRTLFMAAIGSPMVSGRPCLPALRLERWEERARTLAVAEIVMGEAKSFYAELVAERRVTADAARHFELARKISRDCETFAPMVDEMARDADDVRRFFQECLEA